MCVLIRTSVVYTVSVLVLLSLTGSEADRRRQHVRRNVLHQARSGNFCPYSLAKMVSCKTVNGTETYQGKVQVGQRVQFMTMTRPRYVTSFKEVMETEYGCCPGFHGPNCDMSCFNCTEFIDLKSRVRTLEAKLLRSPSSTGVPPTNGNVIEMGPPDTSHVTGHPLNGRRSGGRGNRNGNKNRGSRNRKDRRKKNGHNPRSDIDINEEGNSVVRPREANIIPQLNGQCTCPPGPPGPPGRAGRDGVDGRDGATGPQGLPGQAGSQISSGGRRGSQGDVTYVQGPPGPPGSPGPAGIPGRNGLPGDQGLLGPAGAPGRPGRSGRAGAPGKEGLPGPPGVGSPGPKGEPGFNGISGEPGPVGPIGPPGIIGPQGIKGEQGLYGIAGTPGSPGPKGEIGPVGAPGAPGASGFTGAAGPPGRPGLQGPKGETGLAGLPGQPIPIPGALDQYGGDYGFGDYGFEGSGYFLENDDEDPLRIPPGLRGPPGPPGPKGDKGSIGDRGREGLRGLKGDRGFEGIRGPQDGVPGIDTASIQETVKNLRQTLTLLDARVRILEEELPKIMGLSGDRTLLPGHPDAPYEGSSASRIHTSATDLNNQVDSLNGLVNSAFPGLQDGQNGLSRPDVAGSFGGYGSPSTNEGFIPDPSLTDHSSIGGVGLLPGNASTTFPEDIYGNEYNGYNYNDYDYNNYTNNYIDYDYEYGEDEYDDYYDYADENGGRRKRHPSIKENQNNVTHTREKLLNKTAHESNDTERDTRKIAIKIGRKYEKYNKTKESKDKLNDIIAKTKIKGSQTTQKANIAAVSHKVSRKSLKYKTQQLSTEGRKLTNISPNNQKSSIALKLHTQKFSRKGKSGRQKSRKNEHPLKSFSQRYGRTKRDIGFPWSKFNNDVTWI